MSYLPQVAWSTIVYDVVRLTSTTYRVTVVPIDVNEPGSGEKVVGYYLKDNGGFTFPITTINIDGDPDNVIVTDELEHGQGPIVGQPAFVYKSVGDGEAPYLAPVRHQRLDKSALDYSRSIELDILWKAVKKKFTELLDVPISYIGQSLKSLRVKSDETGIEFYSEDRFLPLSAGDAFPLTDTLTAPSINLTTGADVNRVWQCTNATTGAGEWGSVSTNQHFVSTWNATTNVPVLADGVGTNGYYHLVEVGGTINLGSGNITFVIGDKAIYNGTIWQREPKAEVTGFPLTKTDDTNISITLGGSPFIALLNAVSITLNWIGTLADSRIASSAYWNAKQPAGSYIVEGDARLTNARNAADVYSWAKASIVPIWNQNTTGNAATATNANNSGLWNGMSYLGSTDFDTPSYIMMFDTADNKWKPAFASTAKSFLSVDLVDNTSDADKTVLNSAQWGGISSGVWQGNRNDGVSGMIGMHTNGNAYTFSAAAVQSFLGLGTSAYTTTYIHPTNHAPSIITQDASNRFVTDTEKGYWNAKQPSGSYALTSDSRLSDSRVASDVYAWAKAVTKPTYSYSEVGAQIVGSYHPLENQRLSTTNSPTFINGTFTGGVVSPFIEVTTSSSSSHALRIFGSAGGSRKIMVVGQIGFSNGFTVEYDGTNMVYNFASGNVSVGGIIYATGGNSTEWNAKVSFPGFGTTHALAAYGDHNHSGVYQPTGSYLTSESDPVFTAWNKSTGISITKSQVSDFPTLLSQFTNNLGNYGGFVTGTPWTAMGYLTSITSGNVTTALGYTPLPTRTFGTAANSASTDFAPSSHTHVKANITDFPADIVTASADTYSSRAKALSLITLTQAEYDAISTKDANTLYIIS